MKHLKNIILVAATAIILILMAATIVESSKGTAFVRQHIYTSGWFVVLWGIFAIAAAVYIMQRKSNVGASALLVHASFLIILLGALTSWLLAESGTLHLRQGETTSTMKDAEGEMKALGFEVTLNNFNVVNYPGTDAAMDYVTTLTVNTQEIKVSMNNIGSYNGYRFIQSGYDSDMQGTTLGVYHDPWGIGITYTGYALLFISLITTMFSKKTRIRHLYRQALSLQGAKARAITVLLAIAAFMPSAQAQERVKIDGDIADHFGKICVLYNSRITPINTVATSFVTKLCGKASWEGLSSNQVFAGWIFDVPYWETVKMIEIKEKKAQELLGINGKWASFADFWDSYNNYKLDAPLKKAYKDGDTKLQKQLRDADEKFNIIRMLYGGEMLKMFPYTNKQKHIQWFAPGQPLGNLSLNEQELVFIKKSMDYLAESVIMGDNARAEEIIKKILCLYTPPCCLHCAEQQLAALSQFLLYPAVALIAIGIFIGAIWANVSWGRYWSWDSKETWALITMLIYSAPLHADIKWLRKAQHMHLYMLLAFLSVLMTYFGVNYFLSGMHSYA